MNKRLIEKQLKVLKQYISESGVYGTVSWQMAEQAIEMIMKEIGLYNDDEDEYSVGPQL